MKNDYVLDGSCAIISINHLGGKLECLVDVDDLQRLNEETKNTLWTAKHHTGEHYVRFRHDSKIMLLHRYIMRATGKLVVDHIDGNPLNNQKTNLRLITDSENKQNRQGQNAKNVSGYRNVHWNKRCNKWEVSVKVNNKAKYIGQFDTIEEANTKAIEARGKYYPYAT